MNRPERIFISAAEASGDLHGSNLIKAVREMRPSAEFLGFGGPKMADAGCRLIDDLTTRSAMLLGVIGELPRGYRALRRARDVFKYERPDLVVLIDSPVLNLAVAKHAARMNLETLYYIAPQMWAWGRYRIGKLRRRVRRLAVIFPFEESFFGEHGIGADFVGHPLLDELRGRPVDSAQIERIQQSGSPVVAIFPGSRAHVIREVLPGQIEIAVAIRERHPSTKFIVSDAGSSSTSQAIQEVIAENSLCLEIRAHENAEILSAAHLALIASGTTTLEAAYHRTPMVVMYNSSRLLYHLIGRWLIGTKFLCLPNILAGRLIVPEFMPYFRSTEPIVEEALEILENLDRRKAIQRDLEDAVESLGKESASENTARLAISMLESRPEGVEG
jgi:lipid-A-disaccharide synthase